MKNYIALMSLIVAAGVYAATQQINVYPPGTVGYDSTQFAFTGNSVSIANGATMTNVVLLGTTLTAVSLVSPDITNATLRGTTTVQDNPIYFRTGVRLAYTSHTNGTYDLQTNITMVFCDTSNDVVNLNLPNAADCGSLIYIIKDWGAAETNNINIIPSGALAGTDTVDGRTNAIVINVNFGRTNLMSDGASGWWTW